jgi:hypothetical protein
MMFVLIAEPIPVVSLGWLSVGETKLLHLPHLLRRYIEERRWKWWHISIGRVGRCVQDLLKRTVLSKVIRINKKILNIIIYEVGVCSFWLQPFKYFKVITQFTWRISRKMCLLSTFTICMLLQKYNLKLYFDLCFND